LVRLHRPFPVIASFLPRRGIFSRRNVRTPAVAACPAAIIPDGPPPTMITVLISIERGSL